MTCKQLLANLPPELFLRLFFNVLPNGDTFLHKLVRKTDNTVFYVMR